jgi:FKBP-type peptidyl-prolyl cis-trans isomerase FklB
MFGGIMRMSAAYLTRILAALELILLSAVVQASPQAATPAGASLTGLTVSFKLDARLSGPTYGGERWVSPATLTGASGQDIVEAKAMGVGAKGEPIRISPKWTASDPEMVSVSPGEGDHVKIAVKHAGESKLQVTSDGITKELLIKGEYLPTKAIQISITQLKAQPATVPPQDAPIKSLKAEAMQDAPAFKSDEEKRSYALGMNVASNLQKYAIEVDDDALVRGYKDAVSGKTLLSAQDAQTVVVGLREDLRKKREPQIAGGGKDLAQNNKQEGEAFLAENKAKEGVVTLPSGLQYKVLTAGNGKKPTLNDKVLCNYRGTLLDGTEFDSSYKRGRSATLAMAAVIPGWREALQLMPVGSKWQIYVPPALAYGERGTPIGPRKKGVTPKQKIGPNATLIFEVELLSVEDSGAQRAQQEQSATTNEPSAPSMEDN